MFAVQTVTCSFYYPWAPVNFSLSTSKPKSCSVYYRILGKGLFTISFPFFLPTTLVFRGQAWTVVSLVMISLFLILTTTQILIKMPPPGSDLSIIYKHFWMNDEVKHTWSEDIWATVLLWLVLCTWTRLLLFHFKFRNLTANHECQLGCQSYNLDFRQGFSLCLNRLHNVTPACTAHLPQEQIQPSFPPFFKVLSFFVRVSRRFLLFNR